MEDTSGILKIYTNVLSDILQNKNLDHHLKDVEGALLEVEELINNAKVKNERTIGFENLKNELCFLKYQILERI